MNRLLFNDMVISYLIWNDDFESMLNRFMKNYSLDKNGALKAIEKVKAAVEENEPRRLFVISYMHYSGENHHKLDSKQRWKVYCAADGFGWRRSAELKEINEGWDWSHIRDSSIDGWKRMEKKLNSFGFRREA